VLLEEHPEQQRDIVYAVEHELGRVDPFIVIGTESEFHRQLDEIGRLQPTAVILDVIVPWEKNVEESTTELPPDFSPDQKGGLRCFERLVGHPATRFTPAIIHSVLSQYELQPRLDLLPREYLFVSKDVGHRRLIQTIRKVAEEARWRS
jgi:hypothetical protein